MKFYVTVAQTEYWRYFYEVTCDTEEEAKKLALEDKGKFISKKCDGQEDANIVNVEKEE